MNLPSALLLFCVVLLLASPSSAQNGPPRDIRKDLTVEVGDAFDKLIDLGLEMPGELYSWRPSDGVRSVSEVFIHAAVASYDYADQAGWPVPEIENLHELEARVTEKDEVLAMLIASRDHAMDMLVEMDVASLDERIEHDGETDTTVRSVLIAFSTHTSEHLGQMIAYARMNGVVPPWSQE